MSLFVGGLAFEDQVARDRVKLGILLGSVLAGTSGWLLPRFARREPPRGIARSRS